MRCLVLDPDDPVPSLHASSPLRPHDRAMLWADRPDRVLLLLDPTSRLTAHASVWWTRTPLLEGRRTGFIGHLGCVDPDAAGRVLDTGCELLAARGCALAVGPVDGSTWGSYRVAVEGSNEPAFVLEPVVDRAWACRFARAGFDVLTTYSSSLVDDLGRHDPRAERAAARLATTGVGIRTLDASRWADEIAKVHALSLTAFAGNFLYAPIGLREFADRMYRMRTLIDPRLVLLAERNGELVGFLFALPDAISPVPSVVVKTLAVQRGRCQQGLGAVLVSHVHALAAGLGYRQAVHALMHEGNVSRQISRRYGQPFRRYALFARRLEPDR